MNLKLLEQSIDILAVILFGSTARKDGDAYSDKDVFVLCNDIQLNELLRLKNDFISQRINQKEGICCYRYKDVVLMAKNGSLFLWHLKLQGNIIFSKGEVIEKIFKLLKPYQNYKNDLDYYEILLNDVKESFTRWKELTEFDLSLLFTIARNICILLCYKRDIPKFGRSNPYLFARSLFGENFPLPDWVYPRLCSWKLWYERGVKTQRESSDKLELENILEYVGKLLKFARSECL